MLSYICYAYMEISGKFWEILRQVMSESPQLVRKLLSSAEEAKEGVELPLTMLYSAIKRHISPLNTTASRVISGGTREHVNSEVAV